MPFLAPDSLLCCYLPLSTVRLPAIFACPQDDEDEHPDAQLVETAGGTTMVKLTTSYTAAFGEYLKVVGGPPELGAWDAGAAPALTWGEGDVWTATLELPAGEHEFKVGGG
jgi:hypothetical protein